MFSILNAAFLKQRVSLVWSARRIVGNADAAEDIAQESYLRARRALEIGQIEHIEAFLHQAVRNLALDHLRMRSVRLRFERYDAAAADIENVAADAPSSEDALVHRERLRRLEDALNGLPDRARRIWILNRLEGLSYPEIAARLGVSAGTVFNDMKLAMGHCLDAIERAERD
jgi:RNA polymerase sigma-70 factor (ECF subfamily)